MPILATPALAPPSARPRPAPRTDASHGGGKVPELIALFWVVKIAATTLGETGGDTLSMSLHLGYARSSLVFLAVLSLLVAAQLRTRRLAPALYWSVIVATTTAGTTLADFCDRSLGIGYAGGALLLATTLALTLTAWRLTLGGIASARIVTPAQETFYWAAILVSNTLGTALGDWSAGGVGYEGGALLFGALLAAIAAALLFTRLSHVLLFWTAFVLTRPLGATLGDLLTKPRGHGGLALDRLSATCLIAAFMIACLLAWPRRARLEPPP